MVASRAQHELHAVEQSQAGGCNQQIRRLRQHPLCRRLEGGRCRHVVTRSSQRLDESRQHQRTLIDDENRVRHTSAGLSNTVATRLLLTARNAKSNRENVFEEVRARRSIWRASYLCRVTKQQKDSQSPKYL